MLTDITLCFSKGKNDLQLLTISEDDDYLNFRGEGTDRAYSSGFELTLYYTKNTPPSFAGRLLIPLIKDAENLYSWGLTQHIYTPAEIKYQGIQYGDRPYTGLAYISHSLISSDRKRKQRLITSIRLGTIGKYSFAEEIQTAYHRLVNYQVPEGWEHQIAPDIILNYHVAYEHILINPNSNIEVIGGVQANTGTLHNNLGLSILLRCGIFNEYFTNHQFPAYYNKGIPSKKFQLFFFMRMTGTTVMDNATLQGGFFTHESSPYTIKKDDINRFFMRYEYGITLATKNIGISASEKLYTPEYKGSFSQQVGNITLYIGL